MTRQEALDILGVSHDATEDQIKKAYRRLAMQYHPDRNPGDKEAEEKFKHVQGAYEIATNRVHQGGQERSHRGHHGGRARRQNARHVEGIVSLTFMEAVRGCVKVIQVPRGELCGECSGMGSKGGTAHKTCHLCGGSGRITHSQFGNSFFQMSVPCDACQGRGVLISELCGTCRGRGLLTSQSEVSVSIPAGTYDGMRLCVKGEGDPSPNGERGDLYLLVDVQPHHWFSRSEDDLVCRVPITMSEAILGCKLDVPGINGVFAVNIPAGIQSGTVLRLRGQGVPDPIGGDRGDMLLHVRVETPADAQFDSHLREVAEKLAQVESARVSPQRKAFNAMVGESDS